jgi:hypothetical protein
MGTDTMPGIPDMGTDTMYDVRRTDWQRSTCNVQLSTSNGVTERAHGGDMGTDTVFGPPAERIEGQARYLARVIGF